MSDEALILDDSVWEEVTAKSTMACTGVQLAYAMFGVLALVLSMTTSFALAGTPKLVPARLPTRRLLPSSLKGDCIDSYTIYSA